MDLIEIRDFIQRVIDNPHEIVEIRRVGNGERDWEEFNSRLYWDFSNYEYRFRPKPKRIWVNEYQDGSVMVGHSSEEVATMAARNGVLRVAVEYIEVVKGESE